MLVICPIPLSPPLIWMSPTPLINCYQASSTVIACDGWRLLAFDEVSRPDGSIQSLHYHPCFILVSFFNGPVLIAFSMPGLVLHIRIACLIGPDHDHPILNDVTLQQYLTRFPRLGCLDSGSARVISDWPAFQSFLTSHCMIPNCLLLFFSTTSMTTLASTHLTACFNLASFSCP